MPNAAPTANATRHGGAEEFVDARIRQTRAAVKTADLATGAVTLLAGALAVMLVGAIADHWLVAGGFDRWGRFAVFATGLLGAVLYVATRLGPTLFRRVNPLYAAKEIERESPQLKNSLLNALQLREAPSAPAVRQALERQAADRLAATGDAPIDHTPVVRATQVLLALVALVGVYIVASPKDFFASAGRVLAPWADIAAPSRVQIADLSPGDAQLAQGERLEVSASVTGLAEDELVELVYSTLDGSVVDRRIPMRDAGLEHVATLPPGSGAAAALGLQGDLVYQLQAGDARTRSYRVTVEAAPTIAPTRIRYAYPEYTGFASREVEGVGDLRAIEGTRVTITAEANLPIAEAQIDLGADGRPDVRMTTDGAQATGTLALRRASGDVGDSSTSYVLRFTSSDDQANHAPPQYRVEVIADLSPEVSLVAPEEATLDVRLDERVRIAVEARDPDYALARLQLLGESGGRTRLRKDLKTGDGRGGVTGDAVITPRELGLQPGDVLTYWVVAADNRTPEANTAETPRQRLRVVGSDDGEPQAENRNGPGEPGAEGQPGAPQQGDPSGDRNGAPPPRGGEAGGGGESDPSESAQEPSQGDEANKRPDAEPGEQRDGSDPPPGGIQGAGEEGSGESNDESPAGGSEGNSGSDAESPSTSPSGSGGSDQSAGESGAESDSPPGSQGGGRDQNGQSGEGQGADESPVARDGSDDGSAFERLQDFFKDREGDQTESGEPSGDERDASEEPSDSGGETGSEASEPRGGAEDSATQQRDGDPGERPERDGSQGAGEQDRSGDQSDSRSSETGEDTAPGEPTDRQTGPREGTGSSGQNQAADRGAGQSDDRGAGDASGRPGQEQPAGSETGESDGERPGDGSQSRDGGDQTGDGSAEPGDSSTNPSGDQSDRTSEGQPNQTGDPRRPDGRPEGADSGDPRGESAEGGEPTGESGDPTDRESLKDLRGQDSNGQTTDKQGKPAGIGDRGASSDLGGDGAEFGGDEANLEYAREQTDLVLERLEKQLAQREVDRSLLDKLGWTEQDLQRFVERWRSRQQQAERRGAEGEAQLDRALRSLGLSDRGPTSTRQAPDDQLRDLREAARTKVPPRLREALQRYNRSLNAAPEEGD